VITLVPDGVPKRTRSPFGFQLVDDFTGEPPLGRITPYLDLQTGATWTQTIIAGWVSSTSVLAYPGLGRQADASAPAQTYRVRVDAELYRPFYLATADGIVATAPPYNDTEPTGTFVPTFAQLILIPAVQYQFPAYVPVLRGEIVDTTNQPVANALVTNNVTAERGLSDTRGVFALPLRQLGPASSPYTITASDRNGHTGTLSITLSDVIAGGVMIPIS
jgi:hypothetical protein